MLSRHCCCPSLFATRPVARDAPREPDDEAHFYPDRSCSARNSRCSGSNVSMNVYTLEEGLSCGSRAPSSACRAARARARRTASCRDARSVTSTCFRETPGSDWALACISWVDVAGRFQSRSCRTSQSSKHGLEIARRTPACRASSTASARRGCGVGASTSMKHHTSSSSGSCARAAAASTSGYGTAASGAISMRTVVCRRTAGRRLNARRYSGSVTLPSQQTTTVRSSARVPLVRRSCGRVRSRRATFSRSGRAPAAVPLDPRPEVRRIVRGDRRSRGSVIGERAPRRSRRARPGGSTRRRTSR